MSNIFYSFCEEFLNTSMIENNICQKDRVKKLNENAKRQMLILTRDSNNLRIKNLDNKN